jgi:DNA polymerase III subunit gamma/tau
MAYTVLARRYRSNTFDEVIGQDHIAQTLKKAIESGRIAHAYLFCGTRGTGKTSTARILAKCLNCQSADQPVTEPCGKCDSCKSIARGEDIDVIEIDAASNTGVDNVRDVIISSAYNTPARSRFKIFIIDEVHMLSKSAFNALLKTLEEPPSHVKFILATTEPEKVLATILSRCQRYDFRNIGTREIAGHLKAICKKEKIDADEDALLLVAKAGAGSMRDSLSLLDRLLSVGENKLTVDMIEQLLGMPKAQLIFDLVGAIAGSEVKSTLAQADSIITNGLSVDQLIASLVDHLRNMLILLTCGPQSQLVEVPGLSLSDLTKQADQFDPGALSQDIVILEELRRHARQSQAGRALLDATLVRLALADQFSSIGDLLARANGQPSSAPAQKKKSDEVMARPVPAAPIREPQPAPVVATETSTQDDDDDDLPAVGRVWEGEKVSLATLMAKSIVKSVATAAAVAPAPPISNIEPVHPGDLPAQWQAMLTLLANHGPGLHGILSQGRLIGVEDSQAVIRVPKVHETFVKRLDQNGKKEVIRGVISQVLNAPMGVRFEVDEGSPTATPAPVQQPTARPTPPRETANPTPPPQPVELSNTVRMTEELRDKLYKESPLIRAVVDQLGGMVIKVEE